MIDILIPTLARPGRLRECVANIQSATRLKHRIMFAVETHDSRSARAAEAAGAEVVVNRYAPSYANSLQTAFEQTNGAFFIAANDDFEFTDGWDDLAVAEMADGVHVVGIRNGASVNPETGSAFSTITLTRSAYIMDQSGVIDMPGRVFYPYQHNFVDTEFYFTAVARGVFAPSDALIHHRHPDFASNLVDATYLQGRATFASDAAMFRSRQHLWDLKEAL